MRLHPGAGDLNPVPGPQEGTELPLALLRVRNRLRIGADTLTPGKNIGRIPFACPRLFFRLCPVLLADPIRAQRSTDPPHTQPAPFHRPGFHSRKTSIIDIAKF